MCSGDGRPAQQLDQENRQPGQDCRPDGHGRRRVLPEDEHQHGDADDGGFQDPPVAGQPVLPRPGPVRRRPFRSGSLRPAPDPAGRTRQGANGRSGRRPGPSANPRQRQTARPSGEASAGYRRGFEPPRGRQWPTGSCSRKMSNPMASPRASTAMATAIPNPTRLVVRRLQPRGATAMAPTALSTVSQASMAPSGPAS